MDDEHWWPPELEPVELALPDAEVPEPDAAADAPVSDSMIRMATTAVPERIRVRNGLVRLYGAAAAVIRDDGQGAELLLGDLHESFDDTTEVLVTLSIATLERLEAAVRSGPQIDDRSSRQVADAMLRRAAAYGVSERRSVQSAAWRLDAVRLGDRERVAADLERARDHADDEELVSGATALLAATISLWADRSGRSARRAATELCLAASIDQIR